MKTRSGFTIVELLIVIVIIAVLVAIITVAYNGIQRRSKNSAIIAGATHAVRMTRAYIASENKYPITTNVCLTDDCHNGSATSSWNVNPTLLQPYNVVGNLPNSIPDVDATNNGIWYLYASNRTYNGDSNPVAIEYFLAGSAVNCDMANIADSQNVTLVTPNRSYTSTTSMSTRCVIAIAPN